MSTLTQKTINNGQTFTTGGYLGGYLGWTGSVTDSIDNYTGTYNAYFGTIGDETKFFPGSGWANATLAALGAPYYARGLSTSTGPMSNAASDAIVYRFNNPLPAGQSFLLWDAGASYNGVSGPYTFQIVAKNGSAKVSTAGWSFQIVTPNNKTPGSSLSINAATGTITVNSYVQSDYPDTVVVITPNAPITAISVTASTIAYDLWGLALPNLPSQILFEQLGPGSAAGTIVSWQMNDTNVIGGGVIGYPGPAWTWEGGADFFGTGETDILWRNQNGDRWLWRLNRNLGDPERPDQQSRRLLERHRLWRFLWFGHERHFLRGRHRRPCGVGDERGEHRRQRRDRQRRGGLDGEGVRRLQRRRPRRHPVRERERRLRDLAAQRRRHDRRRDAGRPQRQLGVQGARRLQRRRPQRPAVSGHRKRPIRNLGYQERRHFRRRLFGAPGPAYSVKAIGHYTTAGASDILFQNSLTGDYWTWDVNDKAIVGGGRIGNPGPGYAVPTLPPALRPELPAAIFFQDASGNIASWNVARSVPNGGANFGSPGAGWTFVDVGDFDGNQRPDLLFRNDNGSYATWQTDGTKITGGGSIGSPGSGWFEFGVGDFNGDGMSDIVFTDDSGNFQIWNMAGTSVLKTVNVTRPTGWSLAGIGDFNGDGTSDLLFRDSTTYTPTFAIWDISLDQYVNGGTVGSLPNYSWYFKGVGDFNGDGKSDMLFWDPGSGDYWTWDLNGSAIVGGGDIGNPGRNWNVVGIADVVGNHESAILFQDYSSGQLATWQMNDTKLVGGGVLGTPGTGWTLHNFV